MARSTPYLRWYVAGLCFLATVISYIDRQALSVNAPVIRDDLQLSNAQYSQLVTAFLVAYAIGQPLTGRLVDALGTRVGFTVCMIWWSAAGMLHAIGGGFRSLAVYRFLLGLGEAGSWPGSMRAIAEWFPVGERALAVGWFGSGTAIGALVSPPLVAAMTLAAGWRASFLVTGALGLIWVVAWLALYRPPEIHPRLSADERRLILSERVVDEPAVMGTFTLLRHRKPWGVICGRACVDPVWWFYVFWLPNYLESERGFSLAAIGLFAWIPFLAADAGNLLGGWISRRLLRAGVSLTATRRAVLLTGACGTLAGVPAVGVTTASACLGLISIATFAIGLWTTTAMTLNADVVPRHAVGRMTGLSGAGAGVAGIVATLATGWTVDRFSYRPVFVAAGLLPLAGFALLAWLVGEVRPVALAPAPALDAPARSGKHTQLLR